MQKTDSAVRITHLPTGIVAQCQNERSQYQNKQTALRILKARLYELEREKKEKELLKTYTGDKKKIEWGSQIRSYVMQPYTMVKDHRTDYETGDINKVMDGGIDEFIEAYLKSQKAKEKS
jgi:peptide chain release factor 2